MVAKWEKSQYLEVFFSILYTHIIYFLLLSMLLKCPVMIINTAQYPWASATEVKKWSQKSDAKGKGDERSGMYHQLFSTV